MKQITSKQVAELLTLAMYGVEGMDEDTTLAEAAEFFQEHQVVYSNWR